MSGLCTAEIQILEMPGAEDPQGSTALATKEAKPDSQDKIK